MLAHEPRSVHASAVLVGARAILIRGPSGSGKSRFVWRLLQSGLPFVRLVGDDRVLLQAAHGRLLARPAGGLEGLIEARGLGLRRLPYEPLAAVGLVVDLGAGDAERMPALAAQNIEIAGIKIPRLGVTAGCDALGLALAAIGTEPAMA